MPGSVDATKDTNHQGGDTTQLSEPTLERPTTPFLAVTQLLLNLLEVSGDLFVDLAGADINWLSPGKSASAVGAWTDTRCTL